VAELPEAEVPLKRLLLLLDLARQGQPEEQRAVSLARPECVRVTMAKCAAALPEVLTMYK
jgi:hypothetical protein